MREKIKRADIWQFLRFCVVGALNTTIDFVALNLLLWLYPTTDIGKILEYNSFTVLLACTNSFFWNKYWTFQQRGPITFQEVYRFVVVAGGTTLLNDLLVWLLRRSFPGIMSNALVGANVLKLGAIAGTMSISFFGMRLWVFLQHRLTRNPNPLADYETKKLPSLKFVYDLDTVIIGAIKSVHDVDTLVMPSLSKPKLSRFLIDTSPHQQIVKEKSFADVHRSQFAHIEKLFARMEAEFQYEQIMSDHRK